MTTAQNLITDVISLMDLDDLPGPIIDAIINSEISGDSIDTPVMDALYVKDIVLDFITAVDWVSAPVSILNNKAEVMIDSAGQVLGGW